MHCECGCGKITSIAKKTNRRIGHIAGQHVRFIRGHVAYVTQRRVITPDLWREENRGFTTPCWIFVLTPYPNGYCRVSISGKQRLAHRASYEQFIGQIPPGAQVDHLCRVLSCIRPEHLEAVSPAENIHRSRLSTLTDADVTLIRTSTFSSAALAKLIGVSRRTINDVRSGRTWK